MLNMEDSSTESSWVMNLVTPVLEIFVGRGNVTEFIVRKIAHFTEYFVLGLELELYLKRKWLLAAGVGFVVAFMDETIQMFSGRGPLISDVWLDFFGCITAVAVVGCVMWIIKKRNRNNIPDPEKYVNSGERLFDRDAQEVIKEDRSEERFI